MSEDFQGLMLNPWGSRHFFLTKVLIQMILRADVVIALQQAGEGALSLARQRSRDSGQNWCTRAFYAMEGLSLADAAEKRQILEEVLADLERLASDYVREGEAARTMSGVPKSMQAWFYSQMQDGLAELQEDPECAGAYWTMVALYKELFVSYWLLGNPGTIYQISASGEGYVLHKNDMMWEPYTGEIPGDAVAVSRREAEGKEDEWRGEFWMIQAGNLDDGYYHLYSTTERGVELWIRNGELRFDGEDYKPIEREFHYSMNRENTWKFLSALRLKYGLETSLEEILKMEFGYDDGPWRFRKFCREVEAEFHTINL